MEIIVFDNLIQPHRSGIVGQIQQVRALQPLMDNLSNQVNTQGSCYRPVDLADVSHRAQQAGEEFLKLFQ